jgi:hypothetical protein
VDSAKDLLPLSFGEEMLNGQDRKEKT